MADNVQVQSEKLLKYGKKQLSDKGLESQATTIRKVLDDISNIIPNLQSKHVIPTKENQGIYPDEEFDGLSDVHVSPIPDEYIIPAGNLIIENNGNYSVRELSSIDVNVNSQPNLQYGKTVTENGIYVADNGYDGLGNLIVEVASGGGEDINILPLVDVVNGYRKTMDVYNINFDTNLNNNSWETLSLISNEISKNGYDSSIVSNIYGWNIGDTKIFQTTSGETIYGVYTGVNHDKLYSDGSKVGLSFHFLYPLQATYPMHSSATNAGGWPNMSFKTNTLPTIIDTMPDELKAVLKTVRKYSANGDSGNGTGIVETAETMFVPSAVEVGIGSSSGMYNWAGEGSTYEYFQINGASGRSKEKAWLLRTPVKYSLILHGFAGVSTAGASSNIAANTSSGIVLGFCI